LRAPFWWFHALGARERSLRDKALRQSMLCVTVSAFAEQTVTHALREVRWRSPLWVGALAQGDDCIDAAGSGVSAHRRQVGGMGVSTPER
jgi:hypothetical protein